jgi:sulfur-carrier protein adenylyltransferase/sulfurtransferase
MEMNKTYILLASVLILLGVGLVFLKTNPDNKAITPQKLLTELNENTRYISTDNLARRMIEGDPSIQLVDVRTADEARTFMLRGAVNIPLSDLLKTDSRSFFEQEGKDFIFYSNDEMLSNQAWTLARRIGINHLFVLKGGLNCWVETILQPKEPAQTENQEAFDIYQARLGARQYFTGATLEIKKSQSAENVDLKPKTKTKKVEGGC